MTNTIKTALLLGSLTFLFVWIGGELGGSQGAVIAFIAAAAMNFWAYWGSHKAVLKHYHAQEAAPGDRLNRIVTELADRGKLYKPKVYIVPERTPNAFATGRNPKHAAVAATAGLLELLNDDELAAVMAHELAHVKHRDTLIGTIASTFAGAMAMLAQISRYGGVRSNQKKSNPIMLLFIVIGAPLAALIIRMTVSRVREYAADEESAHLSGKPLSLASALGKIRTGVGKTPLTRGNPAHAHMFIINPFMGGLANLFSSHPPAEERIRRLQALAKKAV
ncbi:M48 family metalloprotease [candidate division KSB1 bacterium]|nr:M48 family metalloprotease [candidate division KSB1 bacterium]